MIDKITTTPTEAGVGYLAGAFSETTRDELEGHPFIYNPVSDKITSLDPLLPKPLRQQTAVTLKTIGAFCEYLRRFKKPESSIYVTGSRGQYAIKASIDHRGTDSLSWSDHKASLDIFPSDSFQRWFSLNKTLLSQEDFADILEERSADIISPPAAEILEMANTLHVTRSLSVKSLRRESSASNTIEYNQEQKLRTGDGSIDIPTSFSISIQPFAGLPNRCTIKALLRPRVLDDTPRFTYILQEIEESIESALDEILASIAAQTSLPIYR